MPRLVIHRVWLSGGLCLVLGGAVAVRAEDMDRYQVILDRRPFGVLAAKMVTNATPAYAESLRLSALWMLNGQARAGFEDTNAKSNFVLGRGERTESGLELLDIRFDTEEVVVSKTGEATILRIRPGPPPKVEPVADSRAERAPEAAPPPVDPGAIMRAIYDRFRKRMSHGDSDRGGQGSFRGMVPGRFGPGEFRPPEEGDARGRGDGAFPPGGGDESYRRRRDENGG